MQCLWQVAYRVCSCLHGLLQLLWVVQNLCKLWIAVHQLQAVSTTAGESFDRFGLLTGRQQLSSNALYEAKKQQYVWTC